MCICAFWVQRLRCAAWRVVLAVLLVAGSMIPAWAQTPVPATLVQAASPMLPYLDWLVDPSGKLTVEDMADSAQQALFRPLNLEKMPLESGTVWLRFTLAPRVMDARQSTYLLDMGEGVPGTPTLYVPKHNLLTGTVEWQEFTPSQRSIFLMPDAQTSPITAYIKMSGMPGVWFAPMLRTPHNAATALERLVRPAVIVMLGVVMLLCLLRGLTERGEWRFWTSLYTGAALLHSVWGVPMVMQGHIPMAEIAAVLAPGVALMLLPHVGRHLMHTRERARIIDVQYILLSLPGAVLALLPLVPGFSWTTRYLELWPLGTLLLVPTTLGAWLMGLAGARRFLLGCLLPPLATALGIMGIGSTVPAPLLATAPLWGVALSALLIAGTAAAQGDSDEDARTSSVNDALGDPALRIVSPEELAQECGDPMPQPVMWEKDAPLRMPADSVALAWEEKLRVPLDTLLREGTALGECSLPPAARQHAQAMQESVRVMSTLLTEPLEQDSPVATEIAGSDAAAGCFDLQQILRDAHDSVASSAEHKNIALSWFMPPHLATRYAGDGRRLTSCIRLLLESAVRATSRGGVQVSVRRVPESVEPGHLLFSVTDTGTGMPPHDRSSMALARAWELAAAHHGFLGVECNAHGASISFTVRLQVAAAVTHDDGECLQHAATPAHADTMEQGAWASPSATPTTAGTPATAAADAGAPVAATGAPIAVRRTATDGVSVASRPASGASRVMLPLIIIADDSLSNRQLLAFFLEGLPYLTQEARSPDEAAELYVQTPACLIIFDGDMPEEDTLSAVARVRAFEAEYAQPAALILALTTDDSRWDALHNGGFTHALVKPITRTGLRRTVQELLPSGASPVMPPVVQSREEYVPPRDEQRGDALGANSSMLPEFGVVEEPTGAETSLFWPSATSDGDDIIETGDPLPDSPPVPDLFLAPLSMTAQDSPSVHDGGAVSAGIPLPVMDSIDARVNARSEAAESTIDNEHGATGVEYTYPHPSPAAPVDASAELPAETLAEAPSAAAHCDAEARSDDADPEQKNEETSPVAEGAKPTIVQVNMLPPVFKAAPSPIAASSLTVSATPVVSAMDMASAGAQEWVGEPMPMRTRDSAAVANAATMPVAAPVPTRIVNPVKIGSAASAPSHVTEWVGEPMPIPKAVPPATPDAKVVESGPVVPSSAPAPLLVPGTRAWTSPVDAPSRVADLLTPYTRASFTEPFVAEDAAAAAVAVPTADMQTGQAVLPLSPPAMSAGQAGPVASSAPAQNVFIPLSFGNDPAAFESAPAYIPSVPATASIVPVGSPVPSREAVRGDRLSLIPVESPLLDFIISSPSAPAPQQSQEKQEVAAAPAVSTLSPLSSPPVSTPAPPVAPMPVPAPVAPAPASAPVQTQASISPLETPAIAGSSAAVPSGQDSPIPVMLEEFDEAMRYARGGFARKNIQAVHEASVYIANRSDTCGLRVLARMARCVGEAAKAEDMEALKNLLPELETAVERNKIALLKK